MADKLYLMADFETTLEEPVRVWAYAVTDVERGVVVKTGDNIDDFIEFISSQKSICYFHNLKFDGEFIIYYLLTHGYTHVDDKPKRALEFSTLIGRMGEFYTIKVNFPRLQRKSRPIGVTFVDSFKLLPFSVRDIGKSFGTIDTKGEIDFFEASQDNYKLTPERLDYVKRDTLVVAQAIKEVYLDYGETKITIGSNALKLYKEDFCPVPFDYIFPILSKEQDNICRLAYKGGYCYVNPLYQGKWVGEGQVFDVNSLYPYAMTMRLPYGVPIEFKGEPDYKLVKENNYLFIVQFYCMFHIKEGYVPTIQVKRTYRFNPTEYLTESDEVVLLTMTSVEWEMFNRHYDIDMLSFNGGYYFKSSTKLFIKYIEHFYEEKAKSTGARRQRAKLYLNNLYGKMATSPINIVKVPFLEYDVSGRQHVSYRTDFKDDKETLRVDVGAFITANAKCYTISAIQANYDRFLYCDTDSIHIMGLEPPNTIKVDAKELGAWKREGEFNRAIFVKPKTYVEIEGEDINVKCCGMPQNIKDDFISKEISIDEFKTGFSSNKKLVPKRVEGGILLKQTTFTIK